MINFALIVFKKLITKELNLTFIAFQKEKEIARQNSLQRKWIKPEKQNF